MSESLIGEAYGREIYSLCDLEMLPEEKFCILHSSTDSGDNDCFKFGAVRHDSILISCEKKKRKPSTLLLRTASSFLRFNYMNCF